MNTPTVTSVDSPTYSKFTVAGILSSMASGNGLSPFSEPGPTFASAVTSVSTPILTPTTLASLEQTFIELSSVPPQQSVTELHTSSLQHGARTQSGFVPPIVDPGFYTDESSNDEYYPTAKRARTEVAVNGSAIVIAPDSSHPQRRTPGPRRSRNGEHLTPEEEERRRVRRERNKLAAAKCRQRRVDQTNALTNETEELEEVKASLESEVESLQQVKEHLEFVLQAHKPVCNKHHLKRPSEIKTESQAAVTISPIPASTPAPEVKYSPLPASSPAPEVKYSPLPAHTARPTSLPLHSTSLPVVNATGIAITTPSSVITTLGLDNLIDHTGLTPLTSGPANCSSQHQRSSDGSSPENQLNSPTCRSLMAL